MNRRVHTVVFTLLALLTVTGWSSASVRPLTAPARAQVVTPDPSPPSSANQRFVIGSDNITNPGEGNPPTFATAEIPDPNAFPTTTVQVHNYEGFANDQRFWLSVRIRQQDPGVEVLAEEGYAQMGLIAPGEDATYTVTFPEATAARVEFEVDGSTDEAVMLTLLQFALDAGFTAAELTGLGGHDAEIGRELAQVVAEQYLADLPSFVPCANAVAAVQRGLTDQEQFTRDLQGCLESPVWQASVDQILTRVAERDWFQQSLNLAGTALPAVGATLKAVKAGQFAVQVWVMYEKFHPEVPGAMVGVVTFIGYAAGFSATPPIGPSPTPLLVDEGVPMLGGSAARTGEMPGPGPTGQPQLLWTFPVETGRPSNSSPAVVASTVYFAAGDGGLYALETATGRPLWRFDAHSLELSSPAVFNGVVYVGNTSGNAETGGYLYAVDAATGIRLWRAPTGFVSTSPAVVDGVVYIASWDVDIDTGPADGFVYAFDAATGVQRWRFDTDFDMRSSPAVAEGLVYFGGYDGPTPLLYAVDAETGAERWRFAANADIASTPVVAEGVVYFSSAGLEKGALYAVDAATGTELWHVETGGAVFNSPAVVDGVVYAGGRDSVLHAFDTATGAERWRFQLSGWVLSSPVVADGVVYIGGGNGVLHALDAATGADQWRFEFAECVCATPAMIDGVVYLETEDGTLYAVGNAPGSTVTQASVPLVPEADEVKRHALEAVEQAGTYREQIFDLLRGRTLVAIGEVDIRLRRNSIVNTDDSYGLYRLGSQVYEQISGWWGNSRIATARDEASLVSMVREFQEPDAGWELAGIEIVDGDFVYVLQEETCDGDHCFQRIVWVNRTTYLPIKSVNAQNGVALIESVYSGFGEPVDIQVPPDALQGTSTPTP